ncbi:Uncharacterised protein [Chryseobacterium nakagawai]|uniref:Uncharacterized protein n=1 Tax=Chryseobacterium nakagawai TaxID=1241982 RepID=A0AAD1DTD0_CHRNA|nr:hypothetical protein [Chryseobacterium nakagawai]AZA93711.1 hypothetical protein EG343_25455 [Chryseobacterium nakagawai]VEH20427.1 Uncharacterised protein [Chryseobacterium nakagawai]
MKKKQFAILLVVACSVALKSQVGINTSPPHPNAVLQLKPNPTVTTAKTFILPQLPDQKNGGIAPASNPGNISITNQLDNGMMYYNTDTGCIDYWVATKSKWGSLCSTPPPSPAITKITNDQDSYLYTFNSSLGTKNPPSINLLADITAPGSMVINTSDATQNTNGVNYTYSGQIYAGNNQAIPLVTTQGYPQNTGVFRYKAVYDSNGDGVPDTVVANQNNNPYTFIIRYQDIIPGQIKNTTASQTTPSFSNPSFVSTLNDLTIPVPPGQKIDATYTLNLTNTNNAYAGSFAFPAITDATAVPSSSFSLSGSYTNKNGNGTVINSGSLNNTTNRDKNPVQGRATDLTTTNLKQTIEITISYTNNSSATVDFSVAVVQDINFLNNTQTITIPSATVTYTTTTPGVI